MKIFLVEDNPGDVVLTREALKEVVGRGFEMEVATDGAIALLKIDQICKGNLPLPDLFFLDLNLPKVHGKDVLRYIRTHAQIQNIPVIVISTSSRQEDWKIIEEYKNSVYVVKPMNFIDFIQALQNAADTLGIGKPQRRSLPV
ncbi:MAG: response regulator [Bacteroidia bacterium]|nr:response regulator [Bacteroidia bacterium]